MRSALRISLGSYLAAAALCAGAFATLPAGVPHADSPGPALPIPALPIPGLPVPSPVGTATA
jgi:hypothetical protein